MYTDVCVKSPANSAQSKDQHGIKVRLQAAKVREGPDKDKEAVCKLQELSLASMQQWKLCDKA